MTLTVPHICEICALEWTHTRSLQAIRSCTEPLYSACVCSSPSLSLSPSVTRESLTVQLPDMKSVADFNETRSNKQE